ncbi:MAG: hypothetical protein WC982_05195 [Advenella sp.]
MPVFLLTIPKQSGGQTIQNNRRAMAVSVDASEEDPLEAARGLAAAADAPNSAIWSRATGGWLSDASVAAAGGLVWLDLTPDTPEVLTGEPDGGGEPLPDTSAVVPDASAVAVLGASGSTSLASGTAAVSAGAIDGVRLPATSGIVTNGQTLAVDGGTVALSVAANVVTAAFTPE